MSLLQMSFSGAILILVITVIRAVAIHRLPKKTFLILWAVAVLRLLLPFSVPSMFSAYTLLEQNAPVQQVREEAKTMPFTQGSSEEAQTETGAAERKPVQNGKTVSPVFVIWLDGMVLCAVFFAVSYVRFRREFRFSLPVTNDFVTGWLRKHRIRRTICIRQSDQITAPLTHGILHPVILLPKQTDWENKRQLSYVLLHEYVHICRFDTAVKLLLIVTLCIHWFNPLVWVMYLLFNRDLELACDESVIRRFGTDARKSYALTLLNMEETKGGLTPLCNNFSKNAIEERIRAIMKTRKRSVITVFAGILLIAAVSLLFATSAKEEENLQKPNAETEKESSPSENDSEDGSAEKPADASDTEAEASVSEETSEEPLTLTFMVEGSPEEVAVDQIAGNGYTICIPKEGWELYGRDEWRSVQNEEVRLMIIPYLSHTIEQVEELLKTDGYVRSDEETAGILEWIFEDNQKMTAVLSEKDGDTWGVFYCHPATAEMEEGFGTRLAAIAQTFRITGRPEEEPTQSQGEYLNIAAGEELPDMSADAKAVFQVVRDFFEAYTYGSREVMESCLSDSFDGDLTVFWGDPKDVTDVSYKGVDTSLQKEVGETFGMSVAFVEKGEDSFWYLAVELIKESDGWKVQFCGLEK